MRNVCLLALALAGATAHAQQQPEIAIVLAFTEGPTVDKDGNVYFSELVTERILKLTPQGVLTTSAPRATPRTGC
jgi:gluconolactonase